MNKRRDIFDNLADEIHDNTEMLYKQGASDAECRNFEIVSVLLPLIGRNLRIMRTFLAFCIGAIIGHLLGELLDALVLLLSR